MKAPCKLAVSVTLALAAAAIAWSGRAVPFIQTIELKTYDWRIRATARPAAPSDDIAIVAIDDDSIRRLEPVVGRWPWPRLVHAALIDFLARAPATLVVYDVLFTEADARKFTIGGEATPEGRSAGGEDWTGPQSDQALAESIAKAGNVVLAADAASEGVLDASTQLVVPLDDIPVLNRRYSAGECVEPRPVLVPPIPALARSARAIGHTFTVLDADGPVRRVVPFLRVGNRDVPSLPVAAALEAQRLDSQAVRAEHERLIVGNTAVPLIEQSIPDFYGTPTRGCRALIAYRGPTINSDGKPTFQSFSFYDLFYSEQQLLEGQPPQVDPIIFKDRIVVVGATAAGTHDVFATPLTGGLSGAEIHANVIDSLLHGRTIGPLSNGRSAALILTVAILVGIASALATPWIGAIAAGLIAATLLTVSLRAMARGLWIPLTSPVTAVALSFVGNLAWHYFVEGREKRQVKRLFSRYVPKDVYEQLLADPSRAALGGRRRRMTVLFSDVRGFTALSEHAAPEAIVGQLNEYFSRMVQVLFEHHGTLDKFVGDMVMGLFGAPLEDEEHAEHAVEAALAMSAALDDLNRRWAAAGKPTLDIGIGISTGDMVAGNIGSDTIMSYTAIGDAVNLGARLEALNKEYGTRIIISEATRQALKGRYDMRPLGAVTVKGKSQAVAIFEVKPT